MDKKMADKLMYIPKDDTQNYPLYKLQLVETCLADAFAVVCLQTVQEFHLCRLNTNAPDRPY